MQVRKAVVLAAGRGTRMGELTAAMPKPMLALHGKPMVEHVFEALECAGIERFLLVTGYRREVIEAWAEQSRWDVECRVQEQVNGTGSATLLGREFVAGDRFVLTFGDILVNPSAYTACMEMLRPDTAAVLGAKYVDDPWRGAAIYENGDRVSRVIEKPPKGTSTTHWNSAGVYVLTGIAFDYLKRLTPSERGEYELTSIFGMMIAHGLIVRMASVGEEWRDLGSPEELAAANAASPPKSSDDCK